MINKIVDSLHAAVADIPDGASLMISGFGGSGFPFELVDAVARQGTRDLTIISNNAGSDGIGLTKLIAAGRVRKIVCSFPRQAESKVFDDLYRQGKIELELVPQGTLAERIRAGGAGIGGFFTPTSVGTELAQGKESRVINGVEHVLESSLRADYALIKGYAGDRWGNLNYWRSGRNFGPVMATAADCTIAQVSRIVGLGDIDLEYVITPGVYVQRVVLAGAKKS